MKLKFRTFFILIMSLVINMQALAVKSQQIVLDARQQIGQTLYYDPAYTTLKYPMGDVPMIKGVCTDVIIRALRLQGVDLQKLIQKIPMVTLRILDFQLNLQLLKSFLFQEK